MNKFYKPIYKNKKFLAFTSLIIFLIFYFFPIIKESKYKNTCIKLSRKGALKKFYADNIKKELLDETGLTIEELAKIEGYKNCLK